MRKASDKKKIPVKDKIETKGMVYKKMRKELINEAVNADTNTSDKYLITFAGARQRACGILNRRKEYELVCTKLKPKPGSKSKESKPSAQFEILICQLNSYIFLYILVYL